MLNTSAEAETVNDEHTIRAIAGRLNRIDEYQSSCSQLHLPETGCRTSIDVDHPSVQSGCDPRHRARGNQRMSGSAISGFVYGTTFASRVCVEQPRQQRTPLLRAVQRVCSRYSAGMRVRTLIAVGTGQALLTAADRQSVDLASCRRVHIGAIRESCLYLPLTALRHGDHGITRNPLLDDTLHFGHAIGGSTHRST